MPPLVSVVMPSFNHERFVAAAVKSALDQSYPNLEIVITDDGSRDNTVGVIRQFSDPRISLEVFPENRGASVAANSSIARSRGEFICYLPSDDVFLPTKLEKQVAFLAAHPDIGAVFALPKTIDERGNPVPPDKDRFAPAFRPPFGTRAASRQEWLRHFFFAGNCLCHPAAMVRRSAYDQVGPFNPRLANLPDFDMWVRLCMAFDIRVMPEQLTAMRMIDSNGNMSAVRRDSVLRSQIESFEILKHYRRLPQPEILAIFADAVARIPGAAEKTTDGLLIELSLSLDSPGHKLFALDTLFRQEQPSPADIRRLFQITGSVDVFGNEARMQAQELHRQMGLAQATIRRLQSELGAALTEIGRLRGSKPAAGPAAWRPGSN